MPQIKENFFENKVVKEYKEAHLDENDNMVAYKVPKGMKISKAMKLFIKDPVVLDKLQTKMSMILQENKVVFVFLYMKRNNYKFEV